MQEGYVNEKKKKIVWIKSRKGEPKIAQGATDCWCVCFTLQGERHPHRLTWLFSSIGQTVS